MRSGSWAIGSLTLLSCAVTAHAIGCLVNDADECGLGRCTSSACIPSEASGPVADSCGIFASSSMGDDANPGTQAAPVRTIAKAIELAGSASGIVYGCAGEFHEAERVTSSVHIFGGRGCSHGWPYVGGTQKTSLTTGPDATPLKLNDGINTTIQDLHVLATAATAPGGSSIAVIADGATAKFIGCTLEAGDGSPGQSGQPFTMTATPGENGVAGGMACSASQVLGGEGLPNTCGSTISLGGGGGPGGANAGSPGAPGEPALSANGGIGASTTGDCAEGTAGEVGMDGTAGANASGLGTIDSNGYSGIA